MLVIPLKVTHQDDVGPTLAAWVDSLNDSSPSSMGGSEQSAASSSSGDCERPQVDFTSHEIRPDLHRLADLRASLSDSIPAPSCHERAAAEGALEASLEYHACLAGCEMRGIPPTLERHPEQFQLRWDCAFDSVPAGRTEPRSDLRYERACVLFNVGAFESYLALPTDGSKKGLTRAVSHCSTAASIFAHLRADVLPSLGDAHPPTVDLTIPTLLMCEKMMLAQGQRCLYETALLRPRPMHLMLSKLATGAAELYDESLTYIQDPVVRSSMPRMSSRWGTFLKAWGLWFRSKAEYHESVHARDRKDWATEIGRLGRALDLAEQALSLGRRGLEENGAAREGGGGGSREREEDEEFRIVLEEVGSTIGMMMELREETMAANPDAAPPQSLQPIRGQNMMTKRSPLPKGLDPKHLAKPMFTGVQGPEARKAADRFRKEMADLVNLTSTMAGSETETARNALAEVNLPQSLAVYNANKGGPVEDGGVPPDLWDRVQTLQESDEVSRLKADLWDLKDVSEMARGILSDLARHMDDDLEMDRLFRTEHPDFEGHAAEEVQGPIRGNMKSCEGWLANAKNGDEVLLRMLETFETDPKFKLLGFSRSRLDRLIPQREDGGHGGVNPNIDTSELSNLLVELSTLIREREVILNTLREEVREYNIRSKLREVDPSGPDAPERYAEAVRVAISSFKGLILDIQVNVDKQPALMDSILAENALFVQKRDGLGAGDATSAASAGREDNALHMLEDAVNTIDRVKKQLKEGKNFYDVVMPRLQQLKSQVSDISIRLTVERCDYEDKVRGKEERLRQEMEDAKFAKTFMEGGGGNHAGSGGHRGSVPGAHSHAGPGSDPASIKSDAEVAAHIARQLGQEGANGNSTVQSRPDHLGVPRSDLGGDLDKERVMGGGGNGIVVQSIGGGGGGSHEPMLPPTNHTSSDPLGRAGGVVGGGGMMGPGGMGGGGPSSGIGYGGGGSPDRPREPPGGMVGGMAMGGNNMAHDQGMGMARGGGGHMPLGGPDHHTNGMMMSGPGGVDTNNPMFGGGPGSREHGTSGNPMHQQQHQPMPPSMNGGGDTGSDANSSSSNLPPGQPGVYSVSHFEQPQVRVDDEKVASLVAMDFDPEKVVAALRKYDNNVEQALNELLSC